MTSSPSLKRPLTGLTPTAMTPPVTLPAMRMRARVLAPKVSAAVPLPPRAASLPRSAPTSKVKFNADPLICSTCKALTANNPDASPWTASCVSTPLMLACQPASRLPTVMLLARPPIFHWLAPTAPPTLKLPNTNGPAPTPDKSMSAAKPWITRALPRPAACNDELPGAGAFQAFSLSELTTCVVLTLTPSNTRALMSSFPLPVVLTCAARASPNTRLPSAPATLRFPLRSAAAASIAFIGPATVMAPSDTRPSPPLAVRTSWVFASLPVICKR